MDGLLKKKKTKVSLAFPVGFGRLVQRSDPSVMREGLHAEASDRP